MISSMSGHTTLSHTILRFSVEEACLPFVLLIRVLCCSSFSFRRRDCWWLSNLRVRLNPRFYNLTTPWTMRVTPSGMHLTFFPGTGKSIQSYMIFRSESIGMQYLTLQLTSLGSPSTYRPGKIMACMSYGSACGLTATTAASGRVDYP